MVMAMDLGMELVMVMELALELAMVMELAMELAMELLLSWPRTCLWTWLQKWLWIRP